jgi:hypothetical protein
MTVHWRMSWCMFPCGCVCAALAQPLGLSSLAILTIDLGTEVAPAISLSFEGEVSGVNTLCHWQSRLPIANATRTIVAVAVSLRQ